MEVENTKEMTLASEGSLLSFIVNYKNSFNVFTVDLADHDSVCSQTIHITNPQIDNTSYVYLKPTGITTVWTWFYCFRLRGVKILWLS